MELGMIGLGKMGAFMTERLVRGGHRVVGFDRDPAAVARVVEKGAGSADSLEQFIAQLKPPRAVWLMVPSGALEARFRSQDPQPFANKLLAMMRHEFGGHAVKTAAKK